MELRDDPPEPDEEVPPYLGFREIVLIGLKIMALIVVVAVFGMVIGSWLGS